MALLPNIYRAGPRGALRGHGMDGGRRHRAAGAEPARQRDLTRRPDRQGNEGGYARPRSTATSFGRTSFPRSPRLLTWLPGSIRRGGTDTSVLPTDTQGTGDGNSAPPRHGTPHGPNP